jgi:hypothetical protein
MAPIVKGKEKEEEKDEDMKGDIKIVEKDEVKEPSKETYDIWSRGGSDVEPSVKMIKLVSLLKEWEPTGDKTIIYSQCAFVLKVYTQSLMVYRDIDARPYRDILVAV